MPKVASECPIGPDPDSPSNQIGLYRSSVHSTESDRRSIKAASGWGLRALYAVLGLLCLTLGVVGLIVPGLPGTPLLLVAAWLFSLSNDRLYRWTTTNRWFGRHVADYRSGLGIPRRVKALAVIMVVAVISTSVFYAIDQLWLRLVVGGLGAFGIAFILTRPTRQPVRDAA